MYSIVHSIVTIVTCASMVFGAVLSPESCAARHGRWSGAGGRCWWSASPPAVCPPPASLRARLSTIVNARLPPLLIQEVLVPPLVAQIIEREETRTASRKAGQLEGAAPYPAAAPRKTVTAVVA